MPRATSAHDRPRYRKPTNRDKPSRNATPYSPPPCEEVVVDVVGMPAGMKRVDIVATDLDPAPEPEPESEPESEPVPEEPAAPHPLLQELPKVPRWDPWDRLPR